MIETAESRAWRGNFLAGCASMRLDYPCSYEKNGLPIVTIGPSWRPGFSLIRMLGICTIGEIRHDNSNRRQP